MQGQPARAISLLAAAQQIAEASNLKIEPELQEPYDQVITLVTEKLSEQDFQSAWKTGQKMDLEQVTKFALEN
jgi:hypothetical protein